MQSGAEENHQAEGTEDGHHCEGQGADHDAVVRTLGAYDTKQSGDEEEDGGDVEMPYREN